MTDRELMQQALDALERGETKLRYAVITALRDRLAQPDAYGYASRLAVAIWEQHYKDVAPQWKPLDDLLGVLTQIDNMTSGLTRLAQPEQEPVAWVGPSWMDPKTRGWQGLKAFSSSEIAGWTPLYTVPHQREKNT